MNCKISCSFGEIVDKKTILCIKMKEIKDKHALQNVSLELEIIRKENPLVDNEDILFDELYKINARLWILEDLIREKSINKVFDEKYIEYAENIHKINDERYRVKKAINLKYKSNLIEEKYYTQNNIDIIELEKGKQLYTNNEYQNSYLIINKLMNKYQNYNTDNNFFIDLLFSYENVCTIFNYENKYYDKINYIMGKIENLNINDNLKNYIKKSYATYSLRYKIYKNNLYINRINDIRGPNISYNNMSFFSKNSNNKTLLIYDDGGIGDKIMLSRFIPLLCNSYSNNNMIFFTNDIIVYLFNKCFSYLKNLEIIPYSKPDCLKKYNHHCSLLMLIKYLNLDYENITFTPLFENIDYKYEELHKNIITDIKKYKKTYIFNWKGNPQASQELKNRRMDLVNAIPLFEMLDINWIVITKNVTKAEMLILNRYNVKFYGDKLDNGGNSFEDSISIIKNVDGLISTDTALVHLSANLNIKTMVLLTLGCEWRWTCNDKFTNWYPNSILLRQKQFGEWDNVIEQIKIHL